MLTNTSIHIPTHYATATLMVVSYSNLSLVIINHRGYTYFKLLILGIEEAFNLSYRFS